MLNLFTEVGDAVLINDPIYTPFVTKTKLNGCKVVSSALVESKDVMNLIGRHGSQD